MLPRLSRRDLAIGAGLMGFGSTAAAKSMPVMPTWLSPEASGKVAALMKVNANGAPRLGTFDGEVIAFGADGGLRPFLGFRGVSRSRRLPSGQLVYEETAIYYDLATGRRLDTFRNPFSGAMTTAPYAATLIEAARLPQAADTAERVQVADGRLTFKEPICQVVQYEHGADGIATTRAAQSSTYSADAAALLSGQTQIASVQGEWLRSGPWPRWLGLEDVPGPCIHHCRFEAGAPGEAVLNLARQDLAGHPRAFSV